MKVLFYAEAINEVIETANYYESRQRGLGRLFDNEFESGLQRIIERPQSWPKQFGEIRRYRLNRFPYGIFYRLDEGVLKVIAVAHLKRKPFYWIDRL